MNHFESDFSTKLINLRAHFNCSQADLGVKCGISLSAIKGYETKGITPSYLVVGQICSYFKVSVYYFYKKDRCIEDCLLTSGENFLFQFGKLDGKIREQLYKLIRTYNNADKFKRAENED